MDSDACRCGYVVCVCNDECIHGLGLVRDCVLCNGKERRQRKDDEWETTDWQDR